MRSSIQRQATRSVYTRRIVGSADNQRRGVVHKDVNSIVGSGGLGGGMGNYATNQLPEGNVDMYNLYSTQKYLPKNPTLQNAIFRQIYRYDSTAGACIELYSNMPWSTFDLGGIKDVTVRNMYEDCFNNLNLETKLPYLTQDYLVLGKTCGSLLFDESKGVWKDLIQHNPDFISVFPIPLTSKAPMLFLTPPKELTMLASKIKNLNLQIEDADMLELLAMASNSNPRQLSNESTFYLPRKAFTDDHLGTSIYTRILSLVMYEAALMNANLVNAYRRAGPIRMISPNSDEASDNLSSEQLDSIAMMFMEADEDPAGSTIVMERGVNVDQLGSNNDQQWRVFDEWDSLQRGKLNALGFSESFISGDNSYRAGEYELSIFLERLKALRDNITNEVIRKHICYNMAKANDFFKPATKAQLDLKIRIKNNNPTFSDYQIPTIQWNKPLTPVGNQDYLSLLEKAEEKGVPISTRTWAAATGIDFNAEMDAMLQDAEDKALIKRYKESNQIKEEDPYGRNDDDEQPYDGVITYANFKLIKPEVLKNLLLQYTATDQSMRDRLIPDQYIVFQLYLHTQNLPHETLTEEELNKLKEIIEQANYEINDEALSEALTEAVSSLNTSNIKQASSDTNLNDKVKEKSKELSKNATSDSATSDKREPVNVVRLDDALKLTMADLLTETSVKHIRNVPVVQIDKVDYANNSESMTERLIQIRRDLSRLNDEEFRDLRKSKDYNSTVEVNSKINELHKLVQSLPEDATSEEIIKHIKTHLKLEDKLDELSEKEAEANSNS